MGAGGRPRVARRDVLGAGSLGITSLVLPAGPAAASTGAVTALVAPTGGVVYGWGLTYNSGVFGTQGTNQTAPVEVTGTSFTWPEIVQVAAGRLVTTALAADGTVHVSGTNQSGVIGNATVALGATVTTPVAADISGVVQVAAGLFWTLALKADGTIWSWGAASAASGLSVDTRTPTDVTSVLWPSSPPSGADRIVQIATNFRQSIALTATGRVFTWGTQDTSFPGVLGQGSTAALTSATAVEITGALAGTSSTENRIIQVSAGDSHSLALGRDGRVYVWGANNGAGALGTGVTSNEGAGAPVDISGFGDLASTAGTAARVVQVSAGQSFSLAVGLDGAVYAWGAGSSGQLGNGGTTSVSVAQRITGIAGSTLPLTSETSRRIVQVSARQLNGYALGADSRVYGWGSGGRVGDGTSDRRVLPVEITASGVFANLSPNPGASLAPRRIVALATGTHNDTPNMLAIDDRG